MASRTVKRAKRRVQKKFDLPGYPEINEFLKVCFEIPLEKDDDLLRSLRMIVPALGNGRTAVALRHLIVRLAQFDELYQLLVDDIETNLKQFEKMRGMKMLADDDEIKSAHRNMMTMAMRLDEFVARMEEVAGQTLRRATKPMEKVDVKREAEDLIAAAEREDDGSHQTR